MLRVSIPSDSQQTLGGGFSFRRNLIKALEKTGEVAVVEVPEADIVLIPSTSMITKETFYKAKELGKKIIVRLDNVPRNSRNKNTGTSRLQMMAQKADAIVWQCQWSKDYLADFIGRDDGTIIYNGVDTEMFNTSGGKKPFSNHSVYLYSRYNRDETKNWEVAWYKYQLIQRANPDAHLVIVGKFADELRQYNFDFFRGEKITYMGIVSEPEEMAAIYRGCHYLLATYFNDCYSNTYQEAMACGVKLYEPNMSGGTPELIKNGVISIDEMAKHYMDYFKAVISK